MIELKYRGEYELVKFRIDRLNKKIWITSSKTGYKEKESSWMMLFDKGKERIQDKITSKLDDAKFIVIINMSMAKIGYSNIQ